MSMKIDIWMDWKKSDLPRAKNLRHVFRFINDLIAINNNDEILKSYKEISTADGTLGEKPKYYQSLSSRPWFGDKRSRLHFKVIW